jgi:predicted GH43/DUF377 family glycosyl hydrolase
MKDTARQIPRDLGVVATDKNVYLFYNLLGKQDDRFRVSTSLNGLRFKRYLKNPQILTINKEKENTDLCSDFRIAKVPNGYLLTYKIQIEGQTKLRSAFSKNLLSWTQTAEIPEISETAMIVPDFMYNDQYVMYFGEREINVAYSKDLKTWDIQKNAVLSPRSNYFDSFSLEIGGIVPLPIGILVIYFDKTKKREGTHHTVGAALLDPTNPQKVLWRRSTPIWEQEEKWNDKQIYPLGVVYFENALFLYFGSHGEGVFAIAFTDFDKLFNKYTTGISKPLRKYNQNPIIRPVMSHSWESQATFNAAAVLENDKVHLLYRAIGDNNLSVIGYASSKDGTNIDERLDEPAFVPSMPFDYPGPLPKNPKKAYMSGGGYGGCEDPRLTKIDDRFYMTYVAFNGWEPPRVALTSIAVDDFLNKNWNWDTPKLISKPGVVNKNAVIFPEKINGKYVVMHRVFPNLLIDYVDDLNFENSFLEGKHKIPPRDNFWDSRKIGAGAPPMKTKDGWLLIYHAVDDKNASQYKIGAMLLDSNDPAKVLYRTNHPIIEPNENYENEGYKSGVVYPCGSVIKDNNLLVYYGGADTVVCVASQNLNTFLTDLKETSRPTLHPGYTSHNVIH